MTDSRFFPRAAAMTAAALAARIDATLADGHDGDRLVDDVAPLHLATSSHLGFLANKKYRDQLRSTKAGVIILHPSEAAHAPAAAVLLLSPNPYKSYALAAQALYPDPTWQGTIIHPTALIDPTATIGANCRIDAYVVIGAGVTIGDHTWIKSHTLIEDGVQIGARCVIGSHNTMAYALVGNHVRTLTGVRVGQDGFGFAIDPSGHVMVPQLGRVVIGDHVWIGANTTIDRGAGPDTEIGAGTMIDNLVQIGHNVTIGRGCILIAQSGIAGSTTLGDHVVLAAQAGIAGHLRVGNGARIAGQSGIMRDVPAGTEVMGSPAQPIKEYLRQQVLVSKLARKSKGA